MASKKVVLNDCESIREVIKRAGYKMLDITSGISDLKASADKIDYVGRKVEWVQRRSKVVLWAENNAETQEILFDRLDRSTIYTGNILVWLQGKQASFIATKGVTVSCIEAFLKGKTSSCRQCKSTSGRLTVCKACGHTMCAGCFEKLPKAGGMQCAVCGERMGSTNILPKTVSDDVELVSHTSETGLPVVEARAPLRPGQRTEVTTVLIDPNMLRRQGPTSIIEHDFHQMILDIYCRTLLKESTTKEESTSTAFVFAHVACKGWDLGFKMAGLGPYPNVARVASVAGALSIVSAMADKSGFEVVYSQEEQVWKSCTRRLKRHGAKTIGLLNIMPFVNERRFQVGWSLVTEVEPDVLLLSDGWGCGCCHRYAKKRCSRCGILRYCSEECQRNDWSHHKLQCKVFSTDERLMKALAPLADADADGLDVDF